MKTNERAIKRVKFTEDTKKDNGAFTPLAKPHPSALRKLWFQRINNGEYDLLKQDLIDYQNKGLTLERLLAKEGESLLRWALVYAPTVNQLQFIHQNIPVDLLKKTLSEEDYSLVNKFLVTESGIEESRPMKAEELSNRIEKIKILLSIEPNRIREIMNETCNAENITEGVKQSVRQALLAFRPIGPRLQNV